jgi:hypothetical protein
MPKIAVKKFSRSKVDTIPAENHQTNVQPEPEPEPEREEVLTQDEICHEGYTFDENDHDLFDDLTNENYVSEEIDKKESKSEKERLKLEKEQLKLDIAKSKESERLKKIEDKALEKLMKPTKKTTVSKDIDDELFSNTPDELLGLDKRQLLKKISEYRNLFPKQLKSFKIKKNPTTEDLQKVISEFDAIVSTDSVEGFALEALLSCVGLAENVSSRTKYNITGTAELLRKNDKFANLCKQLFLKHHVFSNVSVEMQLIICIGMTSMIAKDQNDRRTSVNDLLSQTV